MKVLVARYTVKPGQTDKVIEYLKEMTRKVKEVEPGCIMYRVHRPTDGSDTLLLYEVYENEAARELHRHTEHFKAIIEAQVIPLLERREREFLDVVIDAAQ
ncbi:antibiotic biosynthesis monooxygenase family protein [Paenibacillus filicis]|uniref:Antibiotic biosynthesis monooxygenase family protein n=1 Tax=Paenibacillus filicis TaxID=669464 RepID=A0ABU9DSK1_9BACL